MTIIQVEKGMVTAVFTNLDLKDPDNEFIIQDKDTISVWTVAETFYTTAMKEKDKRGLRNFLKPLRDRQ